MFLFSEYFTQDLSDHNMGITFSACLNVMQPIVEYLSFVWDQSVM